MDPNSSPWAYAYNRIVPSSSNACEDFQHQHMPSMSTPASSSAQSLLLQAAHSGIAGFSATGGNFVHPNPMSGYNPVFQQIYHQATQAAVQPKPAHYASSPVTISQRQISLPVTIDKHDNCRPLPATVSYPSSQSAQSNLPASNYYGENSTSSCTSSPATATVSTTTLSWNTPATSTPQHISANTFITMQQQQPNPDICQDEKVTDSKQTNFHTKAHAKSYGDLIYVENQDQQPEHTVLRIDAQNQSVVSEENYPRPEEGFYTFVDGRLTYNIPAAALNSASITNKLPITAVKVVTPRKQTNDFQQTAAQSHALDQMTSNSFPLYESSTLCSSVHSPPPDVNSVHSNETNNNSSQVIVYKSNLAVQQNPSDSDELAVNRIMNNNSNNSNNRSYVRNSTSNTLTSTTVGVAYSSVITSALQAHQQQLQQQIHHTQNSNCWLGDNEKSATDQSKHNHKTYSAQSSPAQEESTTLYTLPPSVQIKHALLEQVVQNSDQFQSQSINNNLVHRIPAHINVIEKGTGQQHMQTQTHSQQLTQSKDHSVENVLTSNNTLASQIQSSTKIEEIRKPTPQKKAPRKRQPKKTILTSNNHIQHNHIQSQAQRQHPVSEQVIQDLQQQPTIQLQENTTFYDYTNRWMTPKIETDANITHFNNNQHSQQLNVIHNPQPAHSQSPQAHSHGSQYYSVFPQQISTQYPTTHMSQNAALYNLNSLTHGAEQQNQNNNSQNTQHPHNSQPIQTQNPPSNEIHSNPIEDNSTCKVIVPNIEDELNFLSNEDPQALNESSTHPQYSSSSSYYTQMNRQPMPLNNSTSYRFTEIRPTTMRKTGFMDSYLKFLQGERDDSPPPLSKSNKKFSYQKLSTFPVENSNNNNNMSNKRKLNEMNQPESLVPPLSKECSSIKETSTTDYVKTEDKNDIKKDDDGHQIKILSQTQIIPKKRLQAQNIAAANNHVEESKANSNEGRRNQSQIKQSPQQVQSNCHIDPLALPPRREQSLRTAKSRLSHQTLQASLLATDRDEPEEFVDSDTDPAWVPGEDENGDAQSGDLSARRKFRRNKGNTSSKKAGTNRNDLSTTIENTNVKQLKTISATPKTLAEVTNQTGNLSADNFKTGDFIVLRSDLVNDWPTIWQVDSKCILQKYEPFCQNGKMFYRNMSKYASWNLDTKKLYLKAPVRIQVQSHTETIVEFMRSELLADDTEQFIEKIMEDYLTFRDHFEIYTQTMISQVLDPSFLSEINKEKDDYFLASVKTIDDIMENCKRKLLSITPWTRSVIVSIETWPQCHVFTEWGQNNVNQKNCAGCHQPGTSVRFLLFGQPYNTSTMQTVPVDARIAYEKDILLCRICAARADIFHKIAHEKYNLFVICTKRVGEYQKENPDKGSTEILNDLLAENNWVDELFRNMRSSWAEVESLERQKRFRETSQ